LLQQHLNQHLGVIALLLLQAVLLGGTPESSEGPVLALLWVVLPAGGPATPAGTAEV
jgi:hypothetical protein